jgi:hypothetical protein
MNFDLSYICEASCRRHQRCGREVVDMSSEAKSFEHLARRRPGEHGHCRTVGTVLYILDLDVHLGVRSRGIHVHVIFV